MKKLFIVIFLSATITNGLNGQVVINEASSRNDTQAFDEDNDSKDWFELYNASTDTVDLAGWMVSDDPLYPERWVFPSVKLPPSDFLFLFASGKGRRVFYESVEWKSAVLPSDTFRYIIPAEDTPANWYLPGFSDDEWLEGPAGFGYGDDDDVTLVPESTLAVYARISFEIPDTSKIEAAVLHIDYDDGFVAYLNGTEIARQNVNGDPQWNSTASGLHEAEMYLDGLPSRYDIDGTLLKDIIQPGSNVLAIEVHNISETSSDLSMIPFFTLALPEEDTVFRTAPSWIANAFGSVLHTNFKLDMNGETLYLTDTSGMLIDTLYVARTPIDYSVGRATDGAEQVAIFKRATPGESNNSSTPYTNGYESSPLVYPSPGFYSNSIQVTFSAYSSTARIHYTTDGSEPNNFSPRYDGTPINITESSVIAAKSISTTDKLDGITSYASYFIEDTYTLPVLSVITDRTNLFGSSGIFTNWSESWNKPCYVQYFDENKKMAFGQAAGIQVDGGAGGSRSQPQTSFRIEPDHGTYGEGSVLYPLIPDRPEREHFESFYIRNGSNQYLILPYKDAVETRSMGEYTYNYYSAYRPVAVHINGEFYGIYELREKINADFLRSNYGMDTDSLDLIGVSYFKGGTLQPLEGSVAPFYDDHESLLALDPSDEFFIEKADQYFDINNYTDYIIGQAWIANTDWPYNNIKIWRCASTGYRWQYALLDLEWALKPNHWSDSNYDFITFLNNNGPNYPYTDIWIHLMKREEYKFHFINRFADLMNSRYHFDNIGPLEQQYYEEMGAEMDKQFARWAGSSNVESRMETFEQNHNIFRSELQRRSVQVRAHIRGFYGMERQVNVNLDVDPPGAGRVKINTILPQNYPWSGIYFSDIPLTFKAVPNPGYRFVRWEQDPVIPDINAKEFSAEMQEKTTAFKAVFEEGEAEFNGLTISELNYKETAGSISVDWVEIWNGSGEEVSLEGWYLTDSDPEHRYEFEPGASIGPGSRMVVSQDPKIFNYIYPGVENVTGGFLFGFDEKRDRVILYDDLGTAVSSVGYTNNYPWPLEDSLKGNTLELIDPNADIDDPENWIAGCRMGSPGKAYQPCNYSTGSEEIIPVIENERYFSVFPNPASERAVVRFPGNIQGDLILRIYDLYGRELYVEQLNSNKGELNQTIVELEELRTSGMVVFVLNGRNFSRQVRVIIH